MKIQVKLTPEESETFFFNSICNCMGWICGYGLQLDYSKESYQIAKKNWLKENKGQQPCREDIWIQILKDGGELTLIDREGDDERYTITLKDIHERVQNTDSQYLLDMKEGNDDVITANCIIQTVFFNEIVFE